MYRLANIQKFNISSIKQCLNAISKKYLSDPINAILMETLNDDKTFTNNDVARYIFNYDLLHTEHINEVADSTKITKQLLTYATDKYALDTFDGEEFVDFNIIDIHPYKQRITLAISRLGKTIVTEEEVRIDSKNRIYFEYGVSADIKKIYLDRFLYED